MTFDLQASSEVPLLPAGEQPPQRAPPTFHQESLQTDRRLLQFLFGKVDMKVKHQHSQHACPTFEFFPLMETRRAFRSLQTWHQSKAALIRSPRETFTADNFVRRATRHSGGEN